MVSVVIPAYNEERALPSTLHQLFTQPGQYEVLVVDGGSTDATVQIVTTYQSARLLSAPKGRASQMNAGAAEACGEWLLFLHADTQLPPGALARLNALEDNRAVRAGGFVHRFTGDDWRLRLISWLDNLRCRRSRIIYGDQALFVRRTLFEELGGFPEQPWLEDVAFCERLTQVTRPVLLTPPVITDARKFLRMGVWHSLARVLLIILHMEIGLPYCPQTFFTDVR